MKKKVLLIAPVFFDYYKEMIVEMQKMGFSVVYICDAPSNSNLSKAIGRVNKNLIKWTTNRYFKKKVLPEIIEKNFNYVLVVGGMTFSFSPVMISKIKKENPNAVFCLYQWDSENNLPYVTEIHEYFDRIFTFDLNDCSKRLYYRFLPLFYTRMYENIGKEKINCFRYDCSYVGTAHPQKYKLINEICCKINQTMPNQFIYHYMPSNLKYIYHKLFAHEFKKAKISDFKNVKLSSDNLRNIFAKSKCILDAPQAGQTGLTMRTIECLGAKRKLITTNKDIKKYDFYNENNIYIYEGSIDTNSKFFTEDYVEIPKSIYEKYSLKSWLRSIFY